MYVLLDSKLIKCEEVLSRFKMLTTHTHTQPNTDKHSDKNTEID